MPKRSAHRHAQEHAEKSGSRGPAANPWLLHAVVFVCGAVLMGLEIVGSRILAPYFGNSIFVWGSLISVVLAVKAPTITTSVSSLSFKAATNTLNTKTFNIWNSTQCLSIFYKFRRIKRCINNRSQS